MAQKRQIRTARAVTKKEDIDYLVNIKEEDITTSFIMDTFAEFNGKTRFDPYDTITIPPGSYGPEGKKNKNSFDTTVGLWIFNKYFIEKDLFNLFLPSGYINKSIDKKTFGMINTKLSRAILEDDIELEASKRYLMKTQKSMPYVSILSPSHTLSLLLSPKEIEKKKKELAKKYAKELEAGDEIVAEKIETELLEFAKSFLAGDPSMDFYNSGARGSFGNNFKNMYVMKGAIKDPDPNKGYNIAMSNYMNGISREEYATFANSLAAGPYARGKKTEIGGYMEKLYLSAFQHITLDKPGSDCHTDQYIEVLLEGKSIDDYMYSYVIDGNNLVELTSKTIDKYKGKKVKLRFSSLCKSKTGICNKCAGTLLYRLGLKNAGMTLPIIPSTLKNLSMKSFHDSSVVTIEMDPMKAFGLK